MRLERNTTRPVQLDLRTALPVAFILFLAPCSASFAQILLQGEDLGNGQFRLTWSGGNGSYKVYKASNPQLTGHVEIFDATGLTQMTLSVADEEIVYFSVGDSAAPKATITSPALGTAVPLPTKVTMAGTLTATAAQSPVSVYVNYRKATVVGTTSFNSAVDVLLVVGGNTVYATAKGVDGNISVTPFTVLRNQVNTNPTIAFDPFDSCDPTPLIRVTYTDPNGPATLDLSTFRAIWNGKDITSNFAITSSAATFQVPAFFMNGPGVPPGTSTLRVTIADTAGYAIGSTLTITHNGPRLTSISPRVAGANTALTLTGCGFDPNPGNNDVQFGTLHVTPQNVLSSTQMIVNAPPTATDGEVTVTVDGVKSNPERFDMAFGEALTDQSQSPDYAVVDFSGRVYYTQSGDSTIHRINANGAIDGSFLLTMNFNSIPWEITGLAIDPSRTVLYVSIRSPDYLAFYYDLSRTDLQNFWHVTTWPYRSGHVLVYNLAGALLEDYSIVAGGPGIIQTDQSDPAGVTVGPTGIYVAFQSGFSETIKIFRSPLVSPMQFSETFIQYPLADPYVPLIDLSSDAIGNVYGTYCDPGYNRVSCDLYRNGYSAIPYFGTGQDLGPSIVDCRGAVYLTEPLIYPGGVPTAGNRVIQIEPSGQVFTTSTTQNGPYGVDLDREGNLYITNASISSMSNVRRLDYLEPATNKYHDTLCEDDYDLFVNDAGDSNGKVFADMTDTISTPNAQSLVLTAFAQPLGANYGFAPIPSNVLAAWTCTDVDDPGVPPLDNDGSGRVGNDNFGGFDGSPVFTPEPGFTLTGNVLTCGTGGGTVNTTFSNSAGFSTTKVRFHPSDAPGDNFRVTLSLALPSTNGPYTVARDDTTRVITVYKKMRVEIDSMGPAVGPDDPEDDDAVIGDIENPLNSLIRNIFTQAYVEFDAATPHPFNNGDSPFDRHLPDLFSLSPNAKFDQLNLQGAGANRRLSNSSTGDWTLYIQGAYEGYSDRDNDLDGEGNTYYGINNIQYGKYSYVFQESNRDGITYAGHDDNYRRPANVVHEMGHQFGLSDTMSANGRYGIMDAPGTLLFPYLIDNDLRLIRTIGTITIPTTPPTLIGYPSRFP